MNQSLTKLLFLGLLLLSLNKVNAANFTFSNTTVAGGNWNVATNWTRDSGTDADNIPDSDDNVTIPSGRLCILTAAVTCVNLEVIPSGTPRLDLRANLTISGTLFGNYGTSAGIVSPIVSNNPVFPNYLVFTGVFSPTVIDRWDAYPIPSGASGFLAAFQSQGGLATTYTINGNFGCINMEVTNCTVRSTDFIYIGFGRTAANGDASAGTLTINANAQLTVEKNLGFRGLGLTTYCYQMVVRGILDIKGNISVASSLLDFIGKLRLSGNNTSGIVNTSGTNIFWGNASSIEYAGTASMTPGDELKLATSVVTDPKNLLGVTTIAINFPNASNYVNFNRIFRVNKELAFLGGYAFLSNALYLSQAAQITGYSNTNFLKFSGANAKIRKEVTSVGTYTFPIGVSNIFTPIDINLTAVGNATFEEIRINSVGGTLPTCLTTANGNKSYRVYHNIGTTYNGTTGTMKISYAQNTASLAERGPSYVPSSAKIVRCDGTMLRVMSTTAGEFADNFNVLNTVSSNFSNGTYDYIITSDANILPITLRDFKGKTQGEAAFLTWNTEGALNFSHFEIEHSADGETWKNLGKRDYYKQINQYEFKHGEMATGTNYYRLKQVDLSGDFEYSRVITLNFEDGRTIVSARPNIVSDQTTIIVNTQKTGVITLNLVNSVGKIVESKQINAEKGIQEIPFDLSQKPNGIYLINAFEGSTLLQNVKLLKAQ
jgi:hypothetical protein